MMKLILALILFICAANATITAETWTVLTLGEAAHTDQFKVAATLNTQVVATNKMIVTLPASFKALMWSSNGALTLNTHYSAKCGADAITPTSATTTATTSAGDTLTLIFAATCATTKVVEITFLKGQITAADSLTTGTSGVVKTEESGGNAIDAVVTSLTGATTARGTFAAVTDGFTVSSYKATEFANFELKFTTTVTLSTSGTFTVSVPGYKLKATNQCTLVPADGSTAPTVAETAAEDESPWEFTLVGQAFIVQAYTIKCSKVIAPAIQDAKTVAVLIGATTQNAAIAGSKALIAVTAAPPAPFSAAPASAGGSMVAVVLGSFAALCLLF